MNNPAVVQRQRTLGCGPGDDGSTPSPGTIELVPVWSGDHPAFLYDEFTIRECHPVETPLLYDVFVNGAWIGSRRTLKEAENTVAYVLWWKAPPLPVKKQAVPEGYWKSVCPCGAGVAIDYPEIKVMKYCSRCNQYFTPASYYWVGAT